MAGREPKPWYWKARREWYVTIKGIRRRLGPEKDEAMRQFHLLMAGEEPEPQPEVKGWLYASEVADQFKTFIKEERAASTYSWYCGYLNPFIRQFMNHRADTLTASQVREWVNGEWKTKPSRRAALRAIKAAFRHVMKGSDVSEIQLPGETSRDYVVTVEEYKEVLPQIQDETFADLIKFVWMTGARPQEAYELEDSHVNVKNARIVFPKSESKGKKRPRVIYLSKEALMLLKKKLGSGGKVFRRKDGKPYTKDTVRQRFRNLEGKLGFRYCLYHFRHAFAHRSLANGNDALTTATLLGHSSSQTLANVYAHLNQADVHLREALRKAK